jgi:hypothetical protein
VTVKSENKKLEGGLANLANLANYTLKMAKQAAHNHDEAILEHLEERAAIMEYDDGLPRGQTENTIHGIPISELQELADEDWLELQDNPDLLDVFAHAVQTRRMRESGQRPAHYTQISICQHCGPVWLWEGAPEHVEGCPWCFNRVKGVSVPRPRKQTSVKT